MTEKKKKPTPKWKVFEVSYETSTLEEKQLVLGLANVIPSWSNLTTKERRLWMEHKQDYL